MRATIAVAVFCTSAFTIPAADPPAQRVDYLGDPLPDGAMMRFGTVRLRAPISGFGIENDGTVITVGPKLGLRRWTKKNGEPDAPTVIDGSDNWGLSALVSPDGKYVVGHSPLLVHVWAIVPEGKAKEVAQFAIAEATQIRFSPDSSKLGVLSYLKNANGGRIGSVLTLCDINTNKMTKLERVLKGDKFTFSGDGNRLAITTSSGEVQLLHTTTGEQLAKHTIKRCWVGTIDLNHTGDLMVVRVELDNELSEWRFIDALTGERQNNLHAPERTQTVSEFATFAPDGKTILVSDVNGVRWWDPAAGKLIRSFDGLAGHHPRFSPDGKMLVSSTQSKLFRWDAATGKPLFAEQNFGHSSVICAVGASADGKRIATRGYYDQQLYMWDAATGKPLWHTPEKPSWFSRHLEFSLDGKFVYADGPQENQVRKLDAATGKEVLTYTAKKTPAESNEVIGVRLSPDGKTLRATLWSGRVVAWDAEKGTQLKSTPNPFADLADVVLAEVSPDGLYITGESGLGQTGSAYAIDNPEKNLLDLAQIKMGGYEAGVFSDDGKWLTMVTSEEVGEEVRYAATVISTISWRIGFQIPMAGEGRIALSPDCRTLVVAIEDTLDFYDVNTTKLIGQYQIPVGNWKNDKHMFTHVVRFTPDSNRVITGHADGTALVWPLPPRAKR